MNLIYSDDTIGRYIQNIRRMSSAKRMSWIRRMVKANKICIRDTADYYLHFNTLSNEPIDVFMDNYLEKMEILINYLDEYYGDRWDMHIIPIKFSSSIEYVDEQIRTRKFMLIPFIHYPEIHITSENGSEHDIEDIFVGFELRINHKHRRNSSEFEDISISISDLKGFRSTLTYAEWYSGYAHSHLNMLNKPSVSNILCFYDFCTGSGDIALFLSLWRNGEYEFNTDTLGMFFSLVETMLKWESVSGIPHRYINNIREGATSMVVSKVLPDYSIISISNDVNHILEQKYNEIPKFSFICNGNKFDIVFNDEHLEFIKESILSFDYNNIKNVIVKKDGNDLIGYSKNSSNRDVSTFNDRILGKEASFYLSGREIKLNVKPIENVEEINLADYHIRKEILKNIKNEFNKRIYQNQVLQRANAQNAV